MPCTCSVPGCNGNYARSGPKVSTFKFPKNELMRRRWTVAIRRKDFVVTKHSAVCELHFKKSDIETEASAYDPKTGRTLTAPLSVKRLKKGVIPSLLLPGSQDLVASREDPEMKRTRLEKEQLSIALQQSLENVPDVASQPQDAVESSFNSSLPVTRSSENKNTEKPQKKTTKRKRKSGEVTSNKKINGISVTEDCLDQAVPSDIQEIAKSYYPIDSTNCLLSSGGSFQKEYANGEHQRESSSHIQTPTSLDSGFGESSKNHLVLQIKEEPPWEEFSSPRIVENPNNLNYVLQINGVDVSENAASTSHEVDPKQSNSEDCDISFYKKPLKIDSRDEVFGNLIACEMSDLRGNPELYLKTQQSILKLLVEAHFEQISSV